MNTKTLRKIMKFFTLSLGVVDGEGGGDAAVATPTKGDVSSKGPGEGRPAKAAPADENIYGAGEEVEGEEGDKGEKGEENKEGEGDLNFAEGEEGKENEGGEESGGGEGEGEGEGEGGEQEEKSQKATILKLDAETIAALRGNAQPQQPQGEQEEKLTPEQLKQMLNPVEVTPDLVAAIRDEDPVKSQQALQSFANAVVKNAYSIAKLMIQKKEREFSAMIDPIRASHEQAQLQQVRQTFYSKFSHLQKYDKIVKAAAREVSPTNPDGSEKSQEQIFKEVAASTVATLKSLGIVINKPNANPGAGGGNQGSGVPKPNKFSSSGRSGGENRNNQQKDDDQADIYRR